MKKALIIHGHFYQPPRENAWTETLERQPSASPEHDWNERVARECYIPNGAARIVDGEGRVLELVNNYERISFNFGPTLLSWYGQAHPEDYERVIEAGGNALAQGYNHAILPLCNDRDLRTQIRWGLADFEFRFGRPAQAMWLPETAVDDRVLSALADHGMKFAVLAPGQAAEAVDCEPYLWRGRLALFFYDGGLSHGLAFGRLLADAPSCAEKIAAMPGRLLTAATDGESYGHHGAFMDMGLAHLLTRDLPAKGIETTTFAAWLREHPPTRPMEVKRSAWSCAHGLGRWSDDCGCGTEGGHGKWRKPLREALDWLRDELAEVYEREAPFADPWAARDEYIEVVLDRSRADAFLRRHLRRGGDRVRALELLEMQRYAMLMYTSCGWFFDDVSRIETVQNLQYAARAVELSRKSLEGELLRRLALAPGNHKDWPTGGAVYEGLALAGLMDDARVAAHYYALPSRGWRLGRFRKTLTGFQDTVTGRRFRAPRKKLPISELLPDTQARLLETLPADESLAVLEQGGRLGLPPSSARLAQAAAELERRLLEETDASTLRSHVERCKRAGVPIPQGAAEDRWRRLLDRETDLVRLASIVELMQEAGFRHWHFRTQTRVYELLKTSSNGRRAELARLAKLLNVAV